MSIEPAVAQVPNSRFDLTVFVPTGLERRDIAVDCGGRGCCANHTNIVSQHARFFTPEERFNENSEQDESKSERELVHGGASKRRFKKSLRDDSQRYRISKVFILKSMILCTLGHLEQDGIFA